MTSNIGTSIEIIDSIRIGKVPFIAANTPIMANNDMIPALRLRICFIKFGSPSKMYDDLSKVRSSRADGIMKENIGCQNGTNMRYSINPIPRKIWGSSENPIHNTFVIYASYNANSMPAKYIVRKGMTLPF